MRIATIICLALILSACGEQEASAPKIPEVFVVTASEQAYRPSRTYNARVQSANDVEIKAEVSGKLIAVHFKEGDQVKKGDLLFKVDPKPYLAKLARAKSELNISNTGLKIAKKNYSLGKKLVKSGVIAEFSFDKLTARKLKAESQVESAQTVVDSAQIEVDYSSIKAPIDGRIGRSILAVGDLVESDTGSLTTLVGEGDMQIVFQLPERLIVRIKNPDSNISIDNIVVSLKMEDGTEYSKTSKIDYFSNRVDPTTGTIETRVNIANVDDLLRPGMFIRVILSLTDPIQSLLAPQAAVQVDQLGSYVFVVDANDKVVRKNIETDDRIGENVVIVSGLKSGERIIVRGIQKVRPGSIVKASDFIPATKASGSKGQ